MREKVAALALFALLALLAACSALAGLEDRSLIASDLGDGGLAGDASDPLATVQCAESQLVCGDVCVSNTDPANCGACGNVCPTGNLCGPNGCAPSCAPGTEQCDRSCVKLDSDVANCGACGTFCTAPKFATPTCLAAKCGYECNVGYSPCAAGQCCADLPAPSHGLQHGCVVTTAGGPIKCWGTNDDGVLGTGNTTSSVATAVPVVGITAAKQVASGEFSTCALLSNRTVKCWGRNYYGALGDGTITNGAVPVTTPVTVLGVTTASFLANGSGHACVVEAGGVVKCWGANEQGQLGDGTRTSTGTAVVVPGLTGAKALALGATSTCAIVAGGEVRCWGNFSTGLLGDGKTVGSLSPVTVTGITGAVAIGSSGTHTCALLSGTRTVKCWGSNQQGALGVFGADGLTPVQVPGIAGATFLGVGTLHNCVVVNQRATCWGSNEHGELGNGTKTDSTTPVLGPNLTIKSVGAGGNSTCARTVPGSVSCWGRKTLAADYTTATAIGGIP